MPRARSVLLVALLAAGIAAVGAAHAQSTGRSARVGLLCGVRCEGPGYEAFKDGLREAGWVEGRNLTLDVRGGEGRAERLPALAAELVALRPDALVAFAPQPNRAMKNATSSIPIVMVAVADPVGIGLVQSLARPGGNITGVSTLVPGGFISKQLELLTQAAPRATRIAALLNPQNDVVRVTFAKEVPEAATRLGVELVVVEARTPGEVDGAIDAAMQRRAEALLVVGDPIFHSPPARIPDRAARVRLPAMYLPRALVEAGGLMSYGPDFNALSRRAAGYVDRVLKGANPAELPIEQPSTFELAVNLRAAKALGLSIPPALVVRADHVIE
jgi:putative ABC transport system substrate-binding protein